MFNLFNFAILVESINLSISSDLSTFLAVKITSTKNFKCEPLKNAF